MRSLSGFYDIDCEGKTIRCRARGRLRYQKWKPLVGDRVSITVLSETEGVLDEVLPRTNAWERPAVANIDQLVMIASGAIPVTDPYLIDRVTALAELRGCEPVILLNKWDLTPVEDLAELYRKAGFTVIPCSAKTGLGLDEVRKVLAHKISALTGNSGVGKSSLLNALDDTCQIPTGEISTKLGRGRHTTRHVELFRLSDQALVADTPGFASIENQEPELMDKQALAGAFRDFRPYLEDCAFVDCAHGREKGCAVCEAIQAGHIARSRHDSYLRLYDQAKEFKPWEKK